MRACRLVVAAAALCVSTVARAQSWPDLTAALPPQGGGDKDAAVVVGISDYVYLPPIDGAGDNAAAWQQWLVRTRKVPSERAIILRDHEATRERIQKSVERMAKQVGAGGTLWFVFIGHGAPSPSGDDGLLLGADTDADADSLSARGLPQGAVLAAVEAGGAAHSLVLFDACFSGKTADGSAPLVKGLQATLPVRKAAPAARATVLSASETFAGPLPSGKNPAFSYLVLGALRGWGDADSDGAVTVDEAFAFARGTMQAGFKASARLPSRRGPNLVLAKQVREGRLDIDAIFAGRCPTGSVWQGERCTEPMPVECPEGSSWNGSKCVSLCPTGTAWNGRACAATMVECPEGTDWNGTTCEGRRVAVVAPLPSTPAGAARRAGETRRDQHGLTWVWMPPGRFHFGCEPQDPHCQSIEKPGRTEQVEGFWMMQTEVTASVYDACVRSGACRKRSCEYGDLGGRGQEPASCVDANQAASFCRHVEGRLPTAVEWEYAAKSGASRIYPWGDSEPTGSRANSSGADGFVKLAPVGSFPAGDTLWGLKDMAGNVLEWTASNYDSDIECRGGCWDLGPRELRASGGGWFDPARHLDVLGFRCVQ